MKIAVIGGTGDLGYGLALRMAGAGLPIIIGSRDAAKAEKAAAEANGVLGEVGRVQGLSNAEAAAAADLVVIAVPASAQVGTLSQVAPHVGGKVVVDATVALVDGDPSRVEVPEEGSSAQRAQAMLPGARMVSAFHTVSGKLLADLGKEIECDILVTGTDKEAKREVMEVISKMGLKAVDAGPLRNSQTLERLTSLIIGMNIRYKRRHIGLKITGI